MYRDLYVDDYGKLVNFFSIIFVPKPPKHSQEIRVKRQKANKDFRAGSVQQKCKIHPLLKISPSLLNIDFVRGKGNMLP